MSAISLLVRIWKISHSYPGCSFVWKIRVVYFSVKHSYLCNKYEIYKYKFINILQKQVAFGIWKECKRTVTTLLHFLINIRDCNQWGRRHRRQRTIVNKFTVRYIELSASTKIWLKLGREKTIFRVLGTTRIFKITKAFSVLVLFHGETFNCFLFTEFKANKKLITRTKK